jgi:hypothetical protein
MPGYCRRLICSTPCGWGALSEGERRVRCAGNGGRGCIVRTSPVNGKCWRQVKCGCREGIRSYVGAANPRGKIQGRLGLVQSQSRSVGNSGLGVLWCGAGGNCYRQCAVRLSSAPANSRQHYGPSGVPAKRASGSTAAQSLDVGLNNRPMEVGLLSRSAHGRSTQARRHLLGRIATLPPCVR